MVMPGMDALVDQLRGIKRGTHDARVRLYTPHETHGPGGKPIITWEPGPEQPGALLAAKAGGPNIRADQPTPIGDTVLELGEGAIVIEGQRATVMRQDRFNQPSHRAVLIKKVLPPGEHDTMRRCLCTEVDILEWWPV
jgi:hypothetical protein